MAVQSAGCSPVFTAIPVVLLLLSFQWSCVQSACLSSCPSNACSSLHNSSAGYRSVMRNRTVYHSEMRCDLSCCEEYSGIAPNCQQSKASSPPNLTITNKTSTSLTVEWSPPLTPNGVILSYQVSYVGLESVNPLPDSFETNSTLNTNSTTQTVEVAGLLPYSWYSLSVKAFTSAGGGEETTGTFRTEEDYPSSPLNLTITNKTSTSLTVEWSPPLTPNGVILSYQVSYVGLEPVNPVPDSFETISTLNTNGTTLTVEVAALSPYSRYSLSVKAFTSVGGGEETTVTLRTEEDPPSAPGNVSLTNVTTNSITVEWSRPVYPNGVVDLFVIVLIDNNSRAEVDNATIPANASNQTVTFSQLLPAWPYTISVAAYTNTLGNSSTVTVLTLGVTPDIEAMSTDNELYVAEGNTAVLQFVILKADPGVSANNITWYFSSVNGRAILSCTNQSNKYNFSSNCLALMIGNVNVFDGGLYEVFVSTRAGEDSSRMAVTVTGVPPQFPFLMEDKTLQMSTNHTFVCTASGDPRLVFTWRFNEARIENTHPKYSITTNTTVSVLVITDVTGHDEGVYNCSVSNRFGQKAISAHLTVQVPPVITLSPSSTRDVVSGEVLSVTCAAVGEPAPRVLWYHIGLALNTSVSNGVTTVDLTTVTIGKTTTSSLRVLNVTDEDAGLYTCVAVNFLGNDSSDFVVSLVVRPIIAGIDVQSNHSNVSNLTHGGVLTLEEFTPVDLTCSASGLPAPVMVWLKNGVVQTSNPFHTIENTIDNTFERVDGTFVSTTTLRIHSLQLSDASWYTCRAVSGNVSPIPGVTAWTFEIDVRARNECTCATLPCWNGGACIDSVAKFVCQCITVGTLTYIGERCENVTDHGEPPYITERPKDASVLVGNPVTLHCKAGGIPEPVVTWFKDGMALKGPQGVGESYIIVEMTPDHRGVYHCQAKNDKGAVNSEGASVLILGMIQVKVGIIQENQGRRKRQSISTEDLIEQLELLAVNTVLSTESGMNLTVYSIKPSPDNSDEMIVTILTDNTTVPPSTIADIAVDPLETRFSEYSDIFPTYSFLVQETERFDGCPALMDNNCSNVAAITWPQTEIGTTVTVKCPCGVDDELINRLQATRVCGGSYTSGAEWNDPTCDMCRFSGTTRDLCRLSLIENEVQLARALADVSQDTDNFRKEEVSLAVTLLDKVAESTESISEEVVQRDVLSTVGSINNVSPEALKGSQSVTGSSNNVLRIIDIVADNVQVSDEPFQFISFRFGFMVAEVQEVEGGSYQPDLISLVQQLANVTVPDNTSAINISSVRAEIPAHLFTSGKNASRVSSTIFANSALFQPRDQYVNASGEQFTQVGSSVLSVSILGQMVSGLEDDDRVEFVFSKTQIAVEEGKRGSCRFWNVSTDESFGSWDDRGCELVNETDTAVVCKCNHLTHFALLLDISPEKERDPPTVNDVILTWVSYIGACVCIVCLIVTVLMTARTKALSKNTYKKLLIHLCVAMVGLYSSFIVGTFTMPVPVLCGIASALMHYFFLVTFLWMASIAIQVFRNIVQPFKPEIESYHGLSAVICWVIPLFLVSFTLAPQYQNYIHKDFCRVYGYSFWIGILVPFGVIYIFNWIMYIGIIVSVIRRPNLKKEIGVKHKQWKENLVITITLSVLFGLGWVSGLLASTDVKVDYVRIPFEWVFTILNCLQGVLIFYVYCLRPPEIRNKLFSPFLACKSGKRKFTPTSTSKTNSKAPNNTFVVIPKTSTAMGTSPLSDVSNSTLLSTTANNSSTIKDGDLASIQLREYTDMKFLGTAKENLATFNDAISYQNQSVFLIEKESI